MQAMSRGLAMLGGMHKPAAGPGIQTRWPNSFMMLPCNSGQTWPKAAPTFNVFGNVASFTLGLPQDRHDLLVLYLLLHDVALVAGNFGLYVELLLLLLADGTLDGGQCLIPPAAVHELQASSSQAVRIRRTLGVS